jgi:hypothetical protein
MNERNITKTPMQAVLLRWLCHCGGEMRVQSGISNNNGTTWQYMCDKCYHAETDTESFPRIDYEPA